MDSMAKINQLPLSLWLFWLKMFTLCFWLHITLLNMVQVKVSQPWCAYNMAYYPIGDKKWPEPMMTKADSAIMESPVHKE